MIRRPPRSTLSSSSAASDVYKRQLCRLHHCADGGKVELVVLAQGVEHCPELEQGLRAGLDAEEVLGGRRPPLRQAGGRKRCPARLEGVVEQVPVAVVLDHEPVRVAPVVEDLAALDVPADAPGVSVLSLIYTSP